jgi:hypothetical protein
MCAGKPTVGKARYNVSMKDKTYTLQLNGQQVATIDPVGYDTPEYSGMCHFDDLELLRKMAKASEFTSWGEDLPDDISDEDYEKAEDKALAAAGISREDYEMYKKASWEVYVSDGTVMKLHWPMLEEDGGISWRA